MATQVARESSAGPSTKGQPQQPTFSLSGSDVHSEHGTSRFQKATPELGHPASLQIARERSRGSNDLPSLLPGANDKRRRVPEEDNDGEGSMEHHAKLVELGASSKKEVARLEHARIADLERQLSEMVVAQTERDRRNAQLTDQLAQKNALLEQAEANAAEAKKRAGLEQRELQARLDELLLFRDWALERAQQTQQAQIALRDATSRAAEAKERSQRELAEVHAKLEAKESELAAVRLQLRVMDQDAEDGRAKSKAKAGRLQTRTVASRTDLNEDRSLYDDKEDMMQTMEAELTSLKSVKRNEKGIEEMECRNEG